MKKTVMFAILALGLLGSAHAGGTKPDSDPESKEAGCLGSASFAISFAEARDKGASKISQVQALRDYSKTPQADMTENMLTWTKAILDYVYQSPTDTPQVIGDKVYDLCMQAAKG